MEINSSKTVPDVRGSKFPVGSSASKSFGVLANARAIASYRSAGFREEGRLRENYRCKDGNFADVLMMSILRSEWLEKRTAEQCVSGC